MPIALFAESVVAESVDLAAVEYSRQAIEAAFRRADRDGSGYLSPSELAEVFDDLGVRLSNERFAEVLRRFDHDDDGAVRPEEFLRALTPHLRRESADAEPSRPTV